MRLKTHFMSCGLLFAICVPVVLAQQALKQQVLSQQGAGAQNSSNPQTETIPSSQPAQVPNPVNEPGYLEPAQVKNLVHEIWIAEYRIRDLLAQVHPEKWKTSTVTRSSFDQTLQTLHKALDGLEEWRGRFEGRPDSMYFAFETYAAMNATLPRLDGVARAVSQYQNPSLGGQYSQADNRLFDLQQTLQPYVAYLLRGPDQALYVAQTNLAGCQNQLGHALRGQAEPAKPLKNTFVEFHTRHRKVQPESTDNQNSPQGGEKPTSKAEKKPELQSK
jgi:hypothetical protein